MDDYNIDRHIKKVKDISNNQIEAQGYIDNLNDIKKYKESTTTRKVEFELLNLEKVNYIKSLLFILYGLLVLWFVYVMYKNNVLTRRKKGLFIACLVAYPFIAPPLLVYIYDTLMYIKALMTGEIYKK